MRSHSVAYLMIKREACPFCGLLIDIACVSSDILLQLKDQIFLHRKKERDENLISSVFIFIRRASGCRFSEYYKEKHMDK